MHIPVSEAKGQLTELVRRAEAGEEIILTRHGQPTIRLTPVRASVTPADRLKLIERLRRQAAGKATAGATAARSQDELYDKDGMPG